MKPIAIKIPPAATNGIMYETPVISQRRTLEAELTEVPFLLIQLRRFALIVLFSFLSNTPEEWSSNPLGILLFN
jgi:hypothetical protein